MLLDSVKVNAEACELLNNIPRELLLQVPCKPLSVNIGVLLALSAACICTSMTTSQHRTSSTIVCVQSFGQKTCETMPFEIVSGLSTWQYLGPFGACPAVYMIVRTLSSCCLALRSCRAVTSNVSNPSRQARCTPYLVNTQTEMRLLGPIWSSGFAPSPGCQAYKLWLNVNYC